MKFIDDKSNKLSWWNRNYFYVGTFIVIAINVLVFAILSNGEAWCDDNLYRYDFKTVLDLRNLFNAFVAKFGHSSWIHLFGNCLGTALAGLYLERKTGSINFVLLTLSGCILSSMAQVCFAFSIPAGFSCVTFFLFACLIVDYIFSFEKSRRNKTNIILGAILIAIIYIDQMSLGFDNKIIFYPWPATLLTNSHHYGGFIVGIVVGLIINITRLKMSKQSIPNLDINLNKKAKKIVYSSVATFMVVISILCLTLSLVANSRRTITVNLFDQNNYTATYETNKDKPSILEDFLLKYLNTIDYNIDEYAVQVFTDPNFSKTFDIWDYHGEKDARFSYHTIYNFYSHVALTKPTEQNYYLKAFKCYGISFTGNLTNNFDYVKNLTEQSIMPARFYYYFNNFKAWNFVERGKNFSFKLDCVQDKNVTVTYKNEKGEIVGVHPDENGVYTIANVNCDLVINLQY